MRDPDCKVPGCDGTFYSRDMCRKHYDADRSKFMRKGESVVTAFSTRGKRRALCHPDLPHYANDKCLSCYKKEKYRNERKQLRTMVWPTAEQLTDMGQEQMKVLRTKAEKMIGLIDFLTETK